MASVENNKEKTKKASSTPPRRALGRGLSALFNESSLPSQNRVRNTSDDTVVSRNVDPNSKQLRELFIEKIVPNSDQPRKHFNEAALDELSKSIISQGVIQPIVVTPFYDAKTNIQKFKIIAGERRWRASKLAGLKKIPAIVNLPNFETKDIDLSAVIENIQREDLNPIELAEACQKILQNTQITQTELSAKLGISRVRVSNTLRLLGLTKSARSHLVAGKISEGHARCLLSVSDSKSQDQLLAEIVQNNLSVRLAEKLSKKFLSSSFKKPKEQSATSSNLDSLSKEQVEIDDLESKFRSIFNSKVKIKGSLNKGSIEISYSGKDSFSRIIDQLKRCK